MGFIHFILLVSLYVSVHGKHEIYDGHSLYEITVKDVEQMKIANVLENELLLDVWSHPTPSAPGKVLVPASKKENFQNVLSEAEIEYKIVVENIKDALELEDQLLSDAASKSSNQSRVEVSFSRVLTFVEVEAYLQEIARAYPNLVTLESAGFSYEGRNIWFLRISTTNFQDTRKPVIYIQSLLHAREWITLPSTLYAISKLVSDVAEQQILQDVDFIIVPVVNPDGYIYTHVESRFWRKNRATNYLGFCDGVDLNRNFDYNWSQASSSLTCSDTFHGGSPFSEPETSAVRDIVARYGNRIALFLDMHSYGSMILYGYGNGVLPPNALILNYIGVQMAQTIDAVKASWNDDYIVGNVAFVLYQASGSAMDYAKAVGIPYAYTYELPGYRLGLGAFGFLVDPDFIEQAGMETWEGIKTGVRLANNFYRARNAE